MKPPGGGGGGGPGDPGRPGAHPEGRAGPGRGRGEDAAGRAEEARRAHCGHRWAPAREAPRPRGPSPPDPEPRRPPCALSGRE